MAETYVSVVGLSQASKNSSFSLVFEADCRKSSVRLDFPEYLKLRRACYGHVASYLSSLTISQSSEGSDNFLLAVLETPSCWMVRIPLEIEWLMPPRPRPPMPNRSTTSALFGSLDAALIF